MMCLRGCFEFRVIGGNAESVSVNQLNKPDKMVTVLLLLSSNGYLFCITFSSFKYKS